MWPSSSVKQRAGALSEAAERFVSERIASGAAHFSGGRDGLLALCKELERFSYAQDVDEEDERRFIEGAGALLGVLLIEHVAESAHVSHAGHHRVRLGAHGFFDPFAAIDQALDAADVRRSLAGEVARAEAEALALGPISRVVAALAALLGAERPELVLAGQFECTLTLRDKNSGETLELDVRRAVDSTRDQQQAAVENVVRRLLSMLPGAAPEAAHALDDLHKRLVPRLLRAEALRELTSHGKSVLYARPLVSELSVTLLLEHEGRARYVRNDELDPWQLEGEAAHTLALANLRERSARTRIVREELADGVMFVARTGDGRDSARVLLPELWTELQERVGTRVAIAVPHRDTFFACALASVDLVRGMRARAAQDAARAPHALSSDAFELTSTGLCPLEL
jgi:uncharacterized protein YtpQ (UPF0354 family)